MELIRLNRQTVTSGEPLQRSRFYSEKTIHMFKQRLIILFIAAVTTLVGGSSTFAAGTVENKEVAFKVRRENIADAKGVTAQGGSKYPFALSPGFFIVSNKRSLIFETGKSASPQLEAQ